MCTSICGDAKQAHDGSCGFCFFVCLGGLPRSASCPGPREGIECGFESLRVARDIHRQVRGSFPASGKAHGAKPGLLLPRVLHLKRSVVHVVLACMRNAAVTL